MLGKRGLPAGINFKRMKSVLLLLALSVLASAEGAGQPPPVSFGRFFNEDGLSHNTVWAISQDRTGYLWVGTFDGLNRCDGYAFKVYKHDPADPGSISHNAVITITEDRQGDLWLSTNKGMARFYPARGTSIAFDVHAGLQGNQFNPNVSARSRDGALFFGGVNGANGFYPDCIRYNRTVPPVVISDFQILNKPVPLGKGSVLRRQISQTAAMTLSYKHSVLHPLPDKRRQRHHRRRTFGHPLATPRYVLELQKEGHRRDQPPQRRQKEQGRLEPFDPGG